MKKILLFVIAAAITFTSCKKKSDQDEENPDDPFKLEYSNLTTEAHKQDIEKSGIEFVEKINALPEQAFVDVLLHLGELEPSIEVSSVSSVLTIGSAAKNKNVKGIFKAITSGADTVSKLSDLYKIYTWNPTTGEFDESDSKSKLEIKFPSDATKTTNNAVLTFTYVASNVKATFDTESAELPASVSAVLKVNNKEELKLTSSYEYKADGTPTKASINLILGVFALKTKVSNEESTLTSELSFLKGNEVLLSLNTSASGNMNITNANNSEDVEEIIENANATFEIMNIKLVGQVDIKAISNAEKASANLSDSLSNIKGAESWNAHAKFIALNKKDNLIIAKVEFVPVSDMYCYDMWTPNGYVPQCNKDYYLEPRLIFKDNSKLSFEAFFEDGFSDLLDELDEFGDKFEI